MTTTIDPSLTALATRARAASRILATTSTATRDGALRAMARQLLERQPAILEANRADLTLARPAGHTAAFLDRLTLDERRLAALAGALGAVAAQEDPVGAVTRTWRRPNGLEVRKVRIPLGVVLMIYESRPNVTGEAAALCLKSGNAAILRGGKESINTSRAIVEALHAGMAEVGLPADAVQLVPVTDREALGQLVQLEGLIDLCIPRGGKGLIDFVTRHARVPVVKHAEGVCHVYVHRAADVEMATAIILDAKTSRPGVCNAAECLLVDRAVAAAVLPAAGRALVDAGVELRGCPSTAELLAAAGIPVTPAGDGDFGREFLELILAVKVVEDLDGALAHIARYGSEHTEAIVTQDRAAARRFTREVTASLVAVNASTRFNDGGELGLGAEVGISTSRLHAFGPMGLTELTCEKYVVEGDGQVRGERTSSKDPRKDSAPLRGGRAERGTEHTVTREGAVFESHPSDDGG